MSTSDSRNMDATVHDSPDVSIGARLQLVREQQGLTIEQVSAATHVSPSCLKAVEAEQFDLLPADTFSRGLVKIYADYLELDGTETARQFIRERNRNRPKSRIKRLGRQTHSLSPKKLAEPSHISSATVAGILLLLIVATLTAFCLYTGWNPFTYFLEMGQQSAPPPLLRP